MRLGFSLPFAGAWATPDNQITVARRAEELGYSSLWVAQRLLFTRWPPSAGRSRWATATWWTSCALRRRRRP